MNPIIQEILQEYNGELIPSRGGHVELVTPFSAKDLPAAVLAVLSEAVGAPVKVSQGFKPSSLVEIRNALYSCFSGKTGVATETQKRHLILKLESEDQEGTSKFWDQLCRILSKDGYYQTWEMGDNKYDPKVAAAIGEHKERDRGINADDLMNLKIALGPEQDVLDVINSL